MKGACIAITILFCLCTLAGDAQDIIHWRPDYELQLSDFQNGATRVGGSEVYSIATVAGITYNLVMYEVQFSRHLNSKIDCTFQRGASFIIAPDTATALNLLDFARYEFDLTELYARKLRKKLFEKSGFSRSNALESFYNELTAEMNERLGNAGRETEVGQQADKLSILHTGVLLEIEMLSEFCKECSPSKQKKRGK
jgi:hypothetical protein